MPTQLQLEKMLETVFSQNMALQGRRILLQVRNGRVAALLRAREPWLTAVLGVVVPVKAKMQRGVIVCVLGEIQEDRRAEEVL